MDFLGIEKDIPFHRAFSDAYYTAKVLARLDGEVEKTCLLICFISKQTERKKSTLFLMIMQKYISRKFPDKQEALKDREVCSTKCYYCHRNLKRKIRWFTPNGKHYYSLSLL